MMIGEDSTTSRPPFAPASTGNVCRFVHSFAAASAQAGGSSNDTKTPSRRLSRQWVAIRHRRKTPARGTSVGSSVTAFSTSTRSRRRGNGAAASEIDSRRRADRGHRVRTTWPSAAGPSGSTSSPPGTVISSV